MFSVRFESPKLGQHENIARAERTNDWSRVEYEETLRQDGFETAEEADEWIEFFVESLKYAGSRQLVCDESRGGA